MTRLQFTVSASAGQEYIQGLKEANPEIDPAVFSDYLRINDSIYYLENKFTLAPKTVIFITGEEFDYIFDTQDINKGWEEFYRRFPGSAGTTTSFSRIGYNTEKTQAMMELGNMYASLGGQGYLIFLKFTDGEWTIEKINYTWVS